MSKNKDGKIVRVKLVMIDVTEVDQETIIKNIGPFVEVYSKKFEDVKAELTTSIKNGKEKTFVLVSGTRAETQEEKSNRINIDPDKSWINEYSELVNVSKKEAAENMNTMINEGLMLKPKGWLDYKKDKIESFFNVK